MIAPYAASPPAGAQAARAMLTRSVPIDLVRASDLANAGNPAAGGSGVVQASYPGGPCPSCGPPAGLQGPAGGTLAPPGFPAVPGMGGPALPTIPAGAVAAAGVVPPAGTRFPTQRTEIRFSRPTGMKVSWFAAGAAGRAGFSTTQIDTPGRYNFPQGAIYRLRLSNVDGRPGLVLYPTLEVWPSSSKTDPFLAHSAVPVEFTNEDFDQVVAGNFVVKVIYLPDPQFQDVAGGGGLEEIVSTRLEPGTDPIHEAQRRGCILAIVRMGNILLELENSPAMDAPNPYACPPPCPPGPGMGFGMPGPGPMVQVPLTLSQNGPMQHPGPAGPMLAGPYGPPMGPNGPLMGGNSLPPANPFGGPNARPYASPVSQPNPPAPNGAPAIPTGMGPAPASSRDGVPVSKLPETSPIKQVGYAAPAPSSTPLAIPAK
jgi:hypothetical protein